MPMSHTCSAQARPLSTGTPARSMRGPFVVLALFSALVLSFSLLGATSASAVSRNTVLARAQVRVDKPVPYSQSKYYAGYRTDCSGYVSMCWATGSSYNTRTFYKVTHRIPVSALRPGDALLKKGYHIRLFYGWLDEAHTSYVAYESASGVGIAGTRIHSLADDLKSGYVAVRYDRISNSAASRNVLQNGALKVWSKSWGSKAEQPVWWQVSGSWWETLAAPRTDTYHSSKRSIELMNPSGDPGTFTEMSQSAPVLPGKSYRTSAWAKTSSDPAGLELRLVYLNAAGVSVAETTTTGDRARLNNTSFRRMTVLTTSPSDAVEALVTVRLAGAATTDASGTVTTAGSSAILDDISLYRPYAKSSIRTSRTSAYNNKRVTLRGNVTPASAVGQPAVVYIKRPGSTWKRLATTKIYASGSAGAWKTTYTFRRSMRRGTYQFRTKIAGIPGYVGSTSKTVKVKLR